MTDPSRANHSTLAHLRALLERYHFASSDGAAVLALLVTWLTTAKARAEGVRVQVPILQIYGGAGAGKTTLARELGQLVVGDDFEVGSMPRSHDDLALLASVRPVIVLDNLDGVPAWLLDGLARIVTGARVERRTLYKDRDVTAFELRAAGIVTGIAPDLARADVLDRTIPIRLDRLTSFVPAALWAKDGDRHRADARRELADLVRRVRAWHARPTAIPTTERLAEFVGVGRHVLEPWKELRDAFDRGVGSLRSMRVDLAGDADLVVSAVIALAADPTYAGRWLSPIALGDAIAQQVDARAVNSVRDPQRLGILMRRLRARLSGLVEIEKRRTRSGVFYQLRPA